MVKIGKRVLGNTRCDFPDFAMRAQQNTNVGVFLDDYKGFGDPIWNKLNIYIAVNIYILP